jgi:prephenate dehydratase
MKKKIVAFQGEFGAYSEAAALELYGPEITTFPSVAFEDVFDAVNSGKTNLGLIPIENSLAGSIHQNYDLLLEWDLTIVGEYFFRVSHCMMALPIVSLSDVVEVYSHPQALAQSRHNLKSLGLIPIPSGDTAGSAKWIKENKIRNAAALASQRAADYYGLKVLKTELEDNPENFTRFLAISKNPLKSVQDQGMEYKTSIAFNIENKPGSLFRALQVFEKHDINMTKIESRPISGKPWEYMFYIDFIGLAWIDQFQTAIQQLENEATFLKVLGSYPRHQISF